MPMFPYFFHLDYRQITESNQNIDRKEEYHRALQNLAESVQKTQKRLEDLTDETNRVLRTLYSGVLDEVDEYILDHYEMEFCELECHNREVEILFDEYHAEGDEFSRFLLMPRRKALEEKVYNLLSDCLVSHYTLNRIDIERGIWEAGYMPGTVQYELESTVNYHFVCDSFTVTDLNNNYESTTYLVDQRDRIWKAIEKVTSVVEKLLLLIPYISRLTMKCCDAKLKDKKMKVPEVLLIRRKALLGQLERNIRHIEKRFEESKSSANDIWRKLTPLEALETMKSAHYQNNLCRVRFANENLSTMESILNSNTELSDIHEQRRNYHGRS
ncbi:hypothetical protein PRIPAC_95624 [Pristionchus pacificus]|uniref:Uncharacterized protein n=1 Tax=Pristionchus pacificus TaxID=54126 RepID=A0A2A6BXN5_PRIPA|nr:hypothetical protein PRIPAC_95624 [Pristionchus pacificus]|eukprot:PDM70670.1 hypothetical protein PRIPAC_43875 [Pristionchus pacificus]